VYLSPIITQQANLLVKQFALLPNHIAILQENLEEVLDFKLPLEEFVQELEIDASQLLKPDRLFRMIRGVSTNIIWVIIIFITSFHLLRDWEKLREWLFGLSPKHLEPELRRLHQEIKGVWKVYFRGQLIIISILGTLSGFGAAVVGVPLALILGLMAGLLAIIPNLGPAVATAIAAIVSLSQGSTYLNIPNIFVSLLVITIFVCIQLFEGFWLTPRIMGRRLRFHPGLVLIATVSTLFTQGTLMTLIIIPIMGSLKIIFEYVWRIRAGLDPWPLNVDSQHTSLEKGDIKIDSE
jgi:predicted PurR-regulated permease PerM